MTEAHTNKINDLHAWRPAACENYFKYNGREFIYCFNSNTHEHAYYCASTDQYVKDFKTMELM